MAQAIGRINLTNKDPIGRSTYWTEQFLNNLGGDFSVTEMGNSCAVLTNSRSCAGLCSSGSDRVCSDIERAINTAIKVFDTNLQASFIHCANDNSQSCVMEIYIK